MLSNGMEVEISPDVYEAISEIAARVAVDVVRKEDEKKDDKLQKERYKDIKRALKAYRTMKQIVSMQHFTEAEESKIRWEFMMDLMGDSVHGKTPDRVIQEEDKRIQENLYAIYRIDNALDLYEKDVNSRENFEEKRRFCLLRDYYIDGEEKTLEDLAKTANISEKTAYRDIGIAINNVAFYMYGYQGFLVRKI